MDGICREEKKTVKPLEFADFEGQRRRFTENYGEV